MSGNQHRYGSGMPAQAQAQHSRNSSQPFSYDPYQTPTIPSNSQARTTSSSGTPQNQEYVTGDGDIAMEDADPYNKTKYPTRPNHSQRPSAQFTSQEESAAARRYSPMNTLPPSSPYSGAGVYSPQSSSARQSPTRSNPYTTPSQQYYTTIGKYCFKLPAN